MPRARKLWGKRIGEVLLEHDFLKLAIDRLRADPELHRIMLKTTWGTRDVRRATDKLAGTYTVRLFAEFEAGLRQFWAATRKTDSPSRTRDLLDGVAANRRIPDTVLQEAHAVRNYRNALVHERADDLDPLTLDEARAALSRFLNYLPPHW